MAALRHARVVSLGTTDERITWCHVEIEGRSMEAVAFPAMCGPVAEGDRVVVNTTGPDLGLGTGGVGFVLWNLDRSVDVEPGEGHIVKMRYTPWQTEVLAAEAPESPHHSVLESVRSLPGTPVVACGLHSQVGSVAAGIKAIRPEARVGYLMTDSAALPLAFSKQVALLKSEGLVDVTCTSGHAFGGDLEAVNVFSGLAALVHAGGADHVVVAMGPGVVGTGTELGFSAIEQGQVCDAVTALGGRSLAALRISFTDRRTRHVGVSHHTLTALTLAARESTTVVVPVLPEDRMNQVEGQLDAAGVGERHRLVQVDGGPGLRLLAEKGIRPSSMGRSLDDEPDLFVAAAAAGCHAASL